MRADIAVSSLLIRDLDKHRLCKVTLQITLRVAVAGVAFAVSSPTAIAQTQSAESDAGNDGSHISGNQSQATIAEVDRAVFIELVKLAKFNLHFHLEANRHQKWRKLSYPVARESGTALSFAATLIDLKQQIRGLDNPERISRSALKKGVSCAITGNAISGGASALELTQNLVVMLNARQKGYSPERSIAFVTDIVKKTDRLLAARESLVAQEPSEKKRRVMELESKLVRRIRQQLLFEFATWSCHSRHQAWRENTFYAIDSAQNFARMSAGIMAMKAFSSPRTARPSVITALVANSMATLNPIVSNFAGAAIRKRQQAKLAHAFELDRPDDLADDLDDLQLKLFAQSQGSDPAPWLNKVATLTYRTGQMDKNLDRESKEIERYLQIAQQQTISGPLIGLTGVTSSTLGTVAVFGYADDIKTANRLGFSGRITQGCGQAYALINTPYTIIRGIVRNRRLRSRGELPSQIQEERLRRLETYQY